MKKRLYPPVIAVAIINFILFAIKLYIGIRSNSLCIYTDSINNLMDTVSAILGIIGVAFAVKKSTEEHPFGFGRMEYVTSFIMSAVMVFAGASFCLNSFERFLAPTPIWYYESFVVILALTCVVKLIMGICFAIYGKKETSPILKTIILDSFLDCGITAITLVSLTLSVKVGFTLDAFLGLAISIMIMVSGIRLVISSLSLIVGKKDCENEKYITERITEIDGGIKIKSVVIHNYGNDSLWANLVLSIDDSTKIPILQQKIKNEININATIEWENVYE